MLNAPPRVGDTVWIVKVSKERRLYVQRVLVLVAAWWRITLACGGRRITWPPDSINLFASQADAEQATCEYLGRVARHLTEPLQTCSHE